MHGFTGVINHQHAVNAAFFFHKSVINLTHNGA
ncbi:hypothetical protein LTSEURB_0663, partial [Salmonella enterica subsp. enterica serovar Urbana str. R8-2977]